MRRVVLFCLLVLVPAALLAQTAVAPRVHPGQTIWIVTLDGQESTGRLTSIASDQLTMRDAAGEHTYRLETVRSVLVRDSRTNGVKIGALVGGVASGTLLGLMAIGFRCDLDCGAGYSAWRDSAGQVVAGAAFGAGIGAGVGFAIDHFIKGRDVVFERAHTTWALSPWVSRGRLGTSVVVGWP